MFTKKEVKKDDQGNEVTSVLPDSNRTFMNSWNIKQVIVVEGVIPITLRLS